jgi:hypothetical protein
LSAVARFAAAIASYSVADSIGSTGADVPAVLDAPAATIDTGDPDTRSGEAWLIPHPEITPAPNNAAKPTVIKPHQHLHTRVGRGAFEIAVRRRILTEPTSDLAPRHTETDGARLSKSVAGAELPP